MSTNSVIKIKNLDFSFGGPKILENIEIDIQRNEFIGMVGPNGSGKTTLLKIIMGVLIPDKGSVKVLGNPPSQSVQELAICHSSHRFPEISQSVWKIPY